MASPSATLSSLSAAGLVPSPTLAAAQQWTIIADITDLLRRSGDNDAAVGSGVRHILADRPAPGLACSLGPGSTGEDVARMIGGLTVSLPVPFTAIVAAATRERPVMTPVPGTQGYRKLNPAGKADEALAATLSLPARGTVWGRQALMQAGVTIAAETSITLNPEVIPSGPMSAIEAGMPVGAALAGFSMQRILPDVKLRWPADPGLLLSAVITVGGVVAGHTAERVTRELLDRLAKARAS